MVSDPNSLRFDLMQKESSVKPYKVEERSCYFIDTDSKHLHAALNYLCNRGWGRHGQDCMVVDLQLPMQSVPITTDVVSSNLDKDEMYNIMR